MRLAGLDTDGLPGPQGGDLTVTHKIHHTTDHVIHPFMWMLMDAGDSACRNVQLGKGLVISVGEDADDNITKVQAVLFIALSSCSG